MPSSGFWRTGQPAFQRSAGARRPAGPDEAGLAPHHQSYASYTESWEEPDWENVWVFAEPVSAIDTEPGGPSVRLPDHRDLGRPDTVRISVPSLLVLALAGLTLARITPTIRRFVTALLPSTPATHSPTWSS